MNLLTPIRKIAGLLQALVVVMVLGFGAAGVTVTIATPAYAAPACGSDLTIENGANCGKATGTSESLFGDNTSVFTIVANTLVFLVGAISVIFLIIGGLRYVISQGDSKDVTAAKDTILYALVGVVVAIISYALVNFVIGALLPSTKDPAPKTQLQNVSHNNFA